MKLISEVYRAIKPTIDYLADEVIIAQSWKKTHTYMRTHNWYADTLALDVSALGLEVHAKLWALNVREPAKTLDNMELVPAAKTEPWKVDQASGWVPDVDEVRRSDKPPIRPLAHLTVRDQTWATALMMCLADSVETAQGDCGESNFLIAQKNRVYSYGNRLICDWKQNEAWFRWGNGDTYRKFFTDYQNFIKRPIEIGRHVAQSHTDADHVYIINMDLSKFYDHIDRPLLIRRLQTLSSEFGYLTPCRRFWTAAKKITKWRWDNDAQETAANLNIELGSGLPQGLVAAGFFANAYMVSFDRAVGKCIGRSIAGDQRVRLHDYCRYVDDIRLVVSIEDLNIEKVEQIVSKWISDLLSKHTTQDLKINGKKTNIIALADLDNSGSTSGRIALLQNELSGPADREVLDSAMGLLEGLLSTRTDEFPDFTSFHPDHALVDIAKFNSDIRLDSLKRFAANRLESVMRNKRRLSPPIDENGEFDPVVKGNEAELLSKKLIWAWMQDPSLGLVLRKAFEIYPSPDIAEPVFEAIFVRSGMSAAQDNKLTAAMMNYLLADLFRSCVDLHGLFQHAGYGNIADPISFFEVAAIYAQKTISCETVPKFLERQALLFLATLQKTVYVTNSTKTIHHSLHAILASNPPEYHPQRLALFEVAAQITGRPGTIAMLLLQNISMQNEATKYEALNYFAKRGGRFWHSIWEQLRKDEMNRPLLDRLKWAAPVVVTDPKPVSQKLSKIIVSSKNGFEHEAALIKLGLGLTEVAEKNPEALPLSPAEITVDKAGSKLGWDQIWRLRVKKIGCTISKSPSSDPRFIIPDWISKTGDNRSIYWIACILRSAVIGNSDFTGNRWKVGKVVTYKGLRTNWYKRRMGMMHSPEALVGDYATVSSWFSELLMYCLQWPGFEASYIQSKDILSIQNLSSFKDALKKRLVLLDGVYCRISKMPTLITEVTRQKQEKDRAFRLVAVQQLLPRSIEFSKADPKLENAIARAKNRDHLARICQLTYKTLTTKLTADSDTSTSCADLIVFPEVSVHIDDQDLIKRLADKTKSIVFAGLVFTDHDGKLVNIARWFIPDYRESGRQWVIRDQGKAYMTKNETSLGISGYRPCQHILEIKGMNEGPFKISGAICYDATDLKLATDLKGKTDLFVVVAHNKDVRTFDAMASALNYHMYQHVVVVNKGEFGGSTIQAPYREHFDRLISHTHGADQISIKIADLDLAAFRRKHHQSYKAVKSKPAGHESSESIMA